MDVDGSSEVKISNCDIDSFDDVGLQEYGPQSLSQFSCRTAISRSNCHGIKFERNLGGFEISASVTAWSAIL